MPSEGSLDRNARDELIFVVKSAHQAKPPGTNGRICEVLSFAEGIAPFLDRDSLMKMKCINCDHYARSFFPLDGDYGVLDSHEFCHARRVPLHHLSLLSIAKCMEFSRENQHSLTQLASSIIEEDLRPLLNGSKIYDRRSFANRPAKIALGHEPGMAIIRLGSVLDGTFMAGDIEIYVVGRLDPGFGPASASIDRGLRRGPVLVARGNPSTIRKIGLAEILRRVADKRNMDLILC